MRLNAQIVWLLLAVFVVFVPTRAFAQQTLITPTDTQRAYNDRGVQHMFDGSYEQAAASFKSSLALGESNIAWLNYGRAMFKLKRCHEARSAFDEVPGAPVVASPSPDEIATVLDTFSQEWSDACSGRLELECPDEPAQVRIGASEPFDCHPDPIPVVPGLHEVWVEGFAEPFSVTVAAEPRLLSLKRSLTPPTGAEEPDTEEDTPEPMDTQESIRYAERDGGTRRTVGLAVAGAGVAALATSLVLELAVVGPAFDDYEAAQTPQEWADARDRAKSAQRANRVLFFAGLGTTAVGATLFAIPTKRGSVALKTRGAGLATEVKW